MISVPPALYDYWEGSGVLEYIVLAELQKHFGPDCNISLFFRSCVLAPVSDMQIISAL